MKGIKDNVRELLVNLGLKDDSNTELCFAYFVKFDGLSLPPGIRIDLLTQIESITRAKRDIVSDARKRLLVLLRQGFDEQDIRQREPWVLKVLPSNVREELIAQAVEQFRRGYS